MGLTFSEPKYVSDEKISLKKAHSLELDPDANQMYSSLLDEHFKNGDSISMCSRFESAKEFDYFHYVVRSANEEWLIEFGSDRTGNYLVQVRSNEINSTLEVRKQFNMDEKVRTRAKRILGARNHSFALRNCEHVAYYIYFGGWLSSQMCSDAWLHKVFGPYLSESQNRFVNQLPAECSIIREVVPIYEGEHGYIDDGEVIDPSTSPYDNDAFNIVFIGPTGSGKSTLINRLFNKTLCESGGSAESVTSNFSSYSGFATVGGQRRKIIVTDTIGFCDSKLDSVTVVSSVKNFIKTNFAFIDRVVVVCSGRIEDIHKENITQLLTWLEFYKRPLDDRYPFSFVYNKADILGNVEDAEKNVMIMADKLKTGMKTSTFAGNIKFRPHNMSIGIPPTATFSESQENLSNLGAILCSNYDSYSKDAFKRIKVDPKPSSCFIM